MLWRLLITELIIRKNQYKVEKIQLFKNEGIVKISAKTAVWPANEQLDYTGSFMLFKLNCNDTNNPQANIIGWFLWTLNFIPGITSCSIGSPIN